MSYMSKNELKTFDFSQSEISSIKIDDKNVSLVVFDVIINENNPENTGFRKMATNELTLELLKVSEVCFIKDGYTIRDMDGKIREKKEDEILGKEDYQALIKGFGGLMLAGIEKDDGYYKIYVDTEESLVSYTIKVKAESDVAEWERFRNLPDEYK